MKKITLGLSLAAIAFAGAAYAEGAAPGGRGDRTMTRADAQAHAAQMFDRFDANHDGKLDTADKEARRAAIFDRLDADHNGQISRAEFMTFHSDRGGRAEGHEGVGGREGGHGRHGGGMGHRGMGHRGMGGGMMARMADTNHDGVLTRDEFVGAALQHFDRIDANHDGTVTPDERRAAGAAMRQHIHDRMGGEAMGGHDMSPPDDGE